MARIDFNDKDRYDPELRAEAEAIHKARQAMLLEAAQDLKVLSEKMRELGETYEDCSIYNRCWHEVRMAAYTVSRDAEFMQKIGGETYIGNLAAGELGQIIKKKKGTK
jgi:hypothetical protein